MMDPLPNEESVRLRNDLAAIWNAGIAAVSPAGLVAAEIRSNRDLAKAIEKCGRIILLGGGKAAKQMVSGALSALPSDKPVVGQVNVIDGEDCQPTPGLVLQGVREPGENFPTPRGVASTRLQMDWARNATRQDVALVLLSGGASAMMPLPVPGVTLDEKLQATKLLHASGASIHEMNTVRKRISQVKGGGLALGWEGDRQSASFWTLAISDVVGDPPDTIGSGPTYPDTGTPQEALAVLEKYGLESAMPVSVIEALRSKKGLGIKNSDIPWSSYVLVGNNRKAVLGCRQKARELGWPSLDLGSHWELEVGELAQLLKGLVTNIIRDHVPQPSPICILGGGETQLKLPTNPGPGGRNQHLAVLMTSLMGQKELDNSSWLFAGSDGEDGPTTAAGGFADKCSLATARQAGICLNSALASFSSNEALEKIGALFSPGATGTNVADLWIGLISR